MSDMLNTIVFVHCEKFFGGYKMRIHIRPTRLGRMFFKKIEVESYGRVEGEEWLSLPYYERTGWRRNRILKEFWLRWKYRNEE
jgi:hypothetical protein